MSTITMYSTGTCPYCAQAENLLKRKGLTVNKIRIDQDEVEFDNMIAKTGKRTVHYVGGFDNLATLDRNGQLATLLNPSS